MICYKSSEIIGKYEKGKCILATYMYELTDSYDLFQLICDNPNIQECVGLGELSGNPETRFVFKVYKC